jgi:hypothetical protein
MDLNADGFNSDLVPGTTRNAGSRNLDLTSVNEWRVRNNRAPIAESQIDSSRVNILDARVSKQVSLGRGMRAEWLA